MEDFPAINAGVITLDVGKTYIVTRDVDIEGARLVTAGVVNLFGLSSETCSLASIGLDTETFLITSSFPVEISSLTIHDVGSAIHVKDDGAGITGVNWMQTNFVNIPNVGHIEGVDNFLLETCIFENSEGLLFTGTIIIRGSIFEGSGTARNIIEVDADCEITGQFRVTFADIDTSGDTVGVNVSINATIPAESYILDTVKFTGDGMPIAGRNFASDASLFTNCIGIRNTRIRTTMYILDSDTTTNIPAQNTIVAVAGTTLVSPDNLRFSHNEADNTLEYVGVIERTFLISISFSAEATDGDDRYVFYVAVNRGGALNPPGDVLQESTSAINTRPPSQAGAATVQALVTLQPNDRIYLAVENTSGDDNIVIAYMNTIIS